MRALVIDDEKGVRDTLTQRLRSECFAVDSAENGTRGSYLARTNDYDIIILDNAMPGKSGLEVCQEIRKTGRSVPIIILSVLGDYHQKITLINAGADDYVIKPYSFDEVIARIRALMRRPYKLENDIIVMDNVIVDVKQQKVRLDGKSVYLTRKEFMLLEYLLRNRGTVMSRGMIMEHVWDMSSDPFSNTIEAHILSLRKKLNDTIERRFIKTVPGRGYIIEDL